MAGGNDDGGHDTRAAISHKAAELVVAALFFVVGAIVLYDSVRLGSTWGSDGPKPGYFPFYVGLIICICAAVNAVRAWRVPAAKDKAFVQVGQLKLVLSVLVPTAVFAFAVTWIGIYVSAVFFIAFFMRWLGKYPWWKVAGVALGTTVVIYVVFEKWFKVPLPKGPLENLLGLG